MLRLYLRALCELTGPSGRVDLVVFNDPSLPPDRLAAFSTSNLAAAIGCARSRWRFVFHTLRLSRRAGMIVCGHLFQLPVAWLAQRLNPRLRYVLVAHGIEVWRTYSFLERRALLGASRILCVSEFTRREMLARLPLRPERLVVVPNALDPRFASFLTAAADPSSAPVILAVARLDAHDREKGLDHLLQALPAVKAAVPEARLVIVGTGTDLPRLKALAQELGLERAVEFTGAVDDEELVRRYAACRVFALPSRKEGFGLVFLEAMAHGRPCVAARAGGVPEVIDETCGLLVDYGDVPALAQACVAALTRAWDPAAIQRHAAGFSYQCFRDRLAASLPGSFRLQPTLATAGS